MKNEIFDYRDGRLYWRKAPSNNVKDGDEAGGLDAEGYRRIYIKGRMYKRSTITWFIHTGEWVTRLDHINRVRDDDRIENLRVADRTLQSRNRGLFKNNTSGFKGIYKRGDKWRVNCYDRWVGTYKSLTIAVAARRLAEQSLI